MKDIAEIHNALWNIADLEGISDTTKTELIKTYLKSENLSKKVLYEVCEAVQGSNALNNVDLSILIPLFRSKFELFKEIVNSLELNLGNFKKQEDETSYLLTFLLLNENLYNDEESKLKKVKMDFLLNNGVSLDSYIYINNENVLGETFHSFLTNGIIEEEHLNTQAEFKIYLPDFIKCYKPDILIQDKKEHEEGFFYSYLIDKIIDKPFFNKDFKNNFLNYFWETLSLNLNVTHDKEKNIVYLNDEKYHRLNTILQNENEIINNIGVFIEDEDIVECLLKQNKINITSSISNLLNKEKNNKYKGTNKDLNYKYHDKVLLKDFCSNILIGSVIPKLRLVKTDIEIVKDLNESNKNFNIQPVNELISKIEKDVIEKTLHENDNLNKNVKNRL